MRGSINLNFACYLNIVQISIFSFLLSSHLQILKLCQGDRIINVKCIYTERDALLAFKTALTDPSGRLCSWIGEDCCKWSGIQCNNQTGSVAKINLRNPFQLTNGGVGDPSAYKRSCLGGKINPSLLQLEYLDYLDLSFNDFEGLRIPEFIGELKNLRYLNLSLSSFAGEIPPQLGNLSSLQYLDLYADSYSNTGTRELRAEKLAWLSGLISLKYLDLGFVKLNNAGENWLQTVNTLPSLVELHLHYCELQSIPLSLQFINFTSLSVLDLSDNSFNSLIPQWLFNLTSLTKLYLIWNFFNGPIPTGFSHLKSLEVLDLSNNLGLEGQIPGLLGSLSKLKVLDLSANNFNGEIHEFLSFFSSNPNNSLVFLDLNANSLVGELPESFSVLKNLQHLDLSSNGFRGSIPSSIGSLSSLKKLDLSYNKMDGSIPESFGLLSKLVDVNLMANSWTGILKEAHLRNLNSLETIRLTTDSTKPLIFNVSSQWVPSFRLKLIQLENCQVGPLFPIWLQVQSELTSVNLRNVGISDTIPEEWFSQISPKISYLVLSKNQIRGKLPNQLKSPNLNLIDLKSNQFEGPLPLWSTNATEIYLEDNHFSGSIPANIGELMPRMEKFFVSWNRLTGKIPSSLCDIQGLQILSLRSNRISGELPDCWHHSSMFWAIDVSNNSLNGHIPSSFGFLPSLSVLLLSDNKFDGEIPSSLQNCSGLTSIDLKGNKFSGSLAAWMGEKLSSLFMLHLGSNFFSGLIPQQFCNPQNLHIFDLSNNRLSGDIPKCVGNLTGFVHGNNTEPYEQLIYMATKGRDPEYGNYIADLNSINLSGNNLTGGIPEEITSIASLRLLNLSRNLLSRSIPVKIGNLKRLENLDLSHNHLSGPIPESLSSLTSLIQLNLSYNNLAGKIPPMLKFKDPSIYEGNPSLCGPPIPKKCSGH